MIKSLLTIALVTTFAAPVFAQEKEKPQKKEAAVDFQKQIWPIFEKRCVECHTASGTAPDGKPKKPKGGVTLDNKSGITGSKGGKLVIAKNAADSKLMAAIKLPADDEDRMPPAKKGDPLSKEQIDLIEKWIEQGAEFGSWTGKAKEDAKGKEKDKEGGDKPGDKPKDKDKKEKGKEKDSPHARLGAGLEPAAPDAIAAFADGPFQVASIGDGSPLLTVTCAGHTDDVDDAAVERLAAIAKNITDLDLGHTKITDEGCAVIAKMPRLTALDLRQTNVANHGVAALAACKELRSLNLFGTKAGDYGVSALADLRNLESLYVWQTEVSAAAAVRLGASLPEARIVMAADLPEPMTETPNAGRRRAGK